MNILRGEPQYQDYHNPKLENTCKLLASTTRSVMRCMAAAVLWIKFGILLTGLAMLAYFFLQQMVQNRIYFHSNRGFGPGWKQQLAEDMSLAIQYALAAIGGAWLLITLFR